MHIAQVFVHKCLVARVEFGCFNLRLLVTEGDIACAALLRTVLPLCKCCVWFRIYFLLRVYGAIFGKQHESVTISLSLRCLLIEACFESGC